MHACSMHNRSKTNSTHTAMQISSQTVRSILPAGRGPNPHFFLSQASFVILVPRIHSGLGSINPALRSHGHLSLAVGDKVRMWRQVVLAVGGRQLVHLLHGGAVLPGAVRLPSA